jgi:CBS domain containing-hemolysin-like protein
VSALDPVAAVALVVLAVAALVLAGLATAAEAAILALSRGELERGLEEEAPPETVRRRVLAARDDARRTLAALTLSEVAAEGTAAVAVTVLVSQLLAEWWLVVAVSVVAMLVLTFVVASVSPRTIGRRRPVRTVVRLSVLVAVLRGLLGPIAALLIRVGNAFTPGGGVEGGPYGTEADLRKYVDRATESGSVERDEAEMIEGVFGLGATRIREIMSPRTDLVTISADASQDKALRLFLRSGYSRMPVIGESVDDLLGILYLKDVVRAQHASWRTHTDPTAADLARPALFLPEFLHADVVLRRMQADAVHAAVVVDEYGGVAGMVTIEDVLEEIVGEMRDEYDRTEPVIEDLGDGSFRVPARESIDDVGDLFRLDLDDDDVDTIGGLLAKALGRVPLPGSTAEALGLHMVAERTGGRRKRLSTLIVRRASEPARPADTEAQETHDRADH